MFRKIAGFITPPPATPESAPRPAPRPFVPPRNSEFDLVAALKPPLFKLLSAPAVDHPDAQESLVRIKEIARQRGLYVTAFELRTQLDTMPKADATGKLYEKARGYVLSGDFFLAHMRRELEGFRQGSISIGPNVFRGYSDEVVECLARGINVRRAVEMPVTVLDDLLALAADAFERAPLCLELATQIVESMVFHITRHFEHGGPPGSTRIPGSTPPPSPFTHFDAPVVRYLQGVEASLQRIRKECIELLNRFQERGGAAAVRAAGDAGRVEVAQTVLAVAEGAQYAPFAGWMKQRVASLRAPSEPEAARALYAAGARDYESQGDRELVLVFNKLAPLRYRMSAELYALAGDAESIRRTQAKAAQAAEVRRV